MQDATTTPLKLFICYARKDSALRDKLHNHLSALRLQQQISVWYDGEIVAGQEWEPAIVAQLEAADIILLLISADFMASEYIWRYQLSRAMQGHEEGRSRVIPVLLRPVDYQGAPFAKLKILPTDRRQRLKAVTQWSRHDDAFTRLAGQIREAVEQLHARRATAREINNLLAPASQRVDVIPIELPAHYVERKDLIHRLRDLILTSDRGLRTSTVQGLAGIGKTVLARAICDDPIIRATFPDGILWATLGQHADPAIHQRDWIRALGGTVAAAQSLRGGKAELKRLLLDRSMLLILDDTWHTADAQWLQVSGPRCATLTTTRDNPQTQSRTLLHLPPMHQSESHLLLRQAAEDKLVDSAHIDAIAERVGHLPLALEIIGRLLADGAIWSEVLEALHENDLPFLEYEQRSMHAAMSTSVEYLPKNKRLRYYELVVFAKTTTFPIDAVKRLWSSTAKFKAGQTDKLLAEFSHRALIQVDTTLHDLQVNYLKTVVSRKDQQALHAILAKKVIQSIDEIDFDMDFIEYDWKHIASHLAAAKQFESLRRLLTHCAYLEGKIARLGTAALLVDFRLLPGDDLLQHIARAIHLGALILDQQPDELSNQLVGRLGPTFHVHHLRRDYRPHFQLMSHTLTAPQGLVGQPRVKHSSYVVAYTIFHNRQVALSASNDRTIRLWNLLTDQPLVTFRGHAGPITDCAFSPDGKLVLSSSYDATLRLWDATTGHTISILQGHTSLVAACAFSPDGRAVLSASFDRTLRLWDREDGRVIRTFEGHADSVAACAFSPDGQFVLSASHDNTLCLWEISTSQIVKRFYGHTNWVISCAFSPDGQVALSSSSDNTLRLWDMKTGEGVGLFEKHTNWVRACAFSPDKNVALSASDDRTLQLWNLKTGQDIASWHADAPLYCCTFHPDGKHVMAGDSLGNVHFLRLENI